MFSIINLIRHTQTHSNDSKRHTAAQEHSDCGSYRKGGDLGYFTRGMMQKPFEDASFALNIGYMTGIVDTGSGSHIIMRIG
jgi:peptidyl-prolyl cis-trans isomerase NIMA-interacting 1